jgi:hypothetical protein
MPAVCSLQATRLVSSNPPTGGLGGNTAESRTPPQPGLEAVAAVLHGQAGPPRYSIYLSHNERHPIGLLSLYAAEAFAQFGSRMGQGVAEVPHSSTMGR